MIIIKILKKIFNYIENAGKAMNDAEDRMVSAMFEKKDKDDSN
jgi:hypothetical protein